MLGAVDRITHEILLSLDERPTLVVWLFDRIFVNIYPGQAGVIWRRSVFTSLFFIAGFLLLRPLPDPQKQKA